MTQILLVGLGAGLTSALLFATLATGHALSIGLFYLTPLPILLAGIAWNHLAGAIAAAGAAILVGVFLGGWFVLAFLAAIGIPAYTLGYLALLARPVGNGGGERLEWYPPGRLVIAAALLAAVATALTIPAFGTDPESYRAALKAAFERVLRTQTETPAGEPLQLPGARDPTALLEFLAIVMPPAAAVLSMVTILFNLWLAGRIARVSGRLSRPWPDLGAITFPNATPLLLVAAIAASFLPGIVSVAAGILAATLLMAYTILGFSVVHGATRALPARLAVLTGLWLAVFLLGWPLVLVAIVGLADAVFDIRKRVAGRGPPDLPTHRPPNE